MVVDPDLVCIWRRSTKEVWGVSFVRVNSWLPGWTEEVGDRRPFGIPWHFIALDPIVLGGRFDLDLQLEVVDRLKK